MQRAANVTWGQALAWRLERQLLAGPTGGSVADVARLGSLVGREFRIEVAAG